MADCLYIFYDLTLQRNFHGFVYEDPVVHINLTKYKINVEAIECKLTGN